MADRYRHSLRIRYGECDMQRVVFNAHYLAYCDDAVERWLAAKGVRVNDVGWDFMLKKATIEWQGEHAIEISASADDRASAVLDVFKGKLVKRDVSLKVLDASEPRQSGQQSKIGIVLKEGISSEDAKKISKLIRDEGPKGVKAQIQGDELRVSAKSRDDLQAVIALLKGSDLDVALQFVNYR